MPTPINIIDNFKHGGIRQGRVYLVFEPTTPGTYEVTSLGRIKNPRVNLNPNSSDGDSSGRTTVISFTLDAGATMMQHTHEEIEAVGALAYPPDGSDEEAGYDVLFTDGPLTKAEVETALNDVGGRTIPGILLENVYPKPGPQINFGTEDSMIEINIDGILPPDCLLGFATEPVLTL